MLYRAGHRCGGLFGTAGGFHLFRAFGFAFRGFGAGRQGFSTGCRFYGRRGGLPGACFGRADGYLAGWRFLLLNRCRCCMWRRLLLGLKYPGRRAAAAFKPDNQYLPDTQFTGRGQVVPFL